MTGRKQLELAAKACGIEVTDEMRELWNYEHSSAWNPITDQSDSDRMGAKLRIDVTWDGSSVLAQIKRTCFFRECFSDHNNDENAALMAARMRCAAAIGEGME